MVFCHTLISRQGLEWEGAISFRRPYGCYVRAPRLTLADLTRHGHELNYHINTG